jgi:hypothetical protein
MENDPLAMTRVASKNPVIRRIAATDETIGTRARVQ